MIIKKYIHKLPTKSRVALSLASAAAILYCSWPLGYVLNPAVGRHKLASQLEAPHQPFNWLFIVMDTLTGVLILLIGVLQFRRKQHRLLNISVAAYVVFGLLVSIAAVVPLSCDPETQHCGPLINHPAIIVHGVSSIVSVVALLASMLLLLPGIRKVSSSALVKTLFVVMVASWALFGLGSLIEMYRHITGNTLQYYFITVCSLSVVFIVGVIEHIYKSKSAYELAHIDDKEYDKP